MLSKSVILGDSLPKEEERWLEHKRRAQLLDLETDEELESDRKKQKIQSHLKNLVRSNFYFANLSEFQG